MLIRLSPQILVIGKRMVAQTAQTRSVAQHDNDNAHDEQGDGGHGGIKEVKSHCYLDVALALLQLHVFLALALLVQSATLWTWWTLVLLLVMMMVRRVHGLQVVNADDNVVGEHLLMGCGLEEVIVSKQ